MKTYYLLGLLFFIVACNEKTRTKEIEVIIDKFPFEVILTGTEIKIPPILLKPSNMCVVDSFMVVTQSRHDSIFSIFKLPNCTHLLSFGNKGKGPNEFNLSFEYVTLGTVNGKSSSFAVGNMMTKIQYYKITDVIDKNFEPYRIESLPPKLNGYRSIAYISDSLIIGAPYRGNMNLFKFNTSTKKLETLKEYPEKFPLMDPEMMREVYGCALAVKPDNSRFALAYACIGIIEINDLKSGKAITISYKGFPSLEKNTGLTSTSISRKPNSDEQYFCANISATDKYIYASIYNEKCSKIFYKDGPNRTFIPEIHVFDWSGNPKVKIKLDDYYSLFDIDLMDKYLYTINDNIENKIERYDLSKLLH